MCVATDELSLETYFWSTYDLQAIRFGAKVDFRCKLKMDQKYLGANSWAKLIGIE